MGATLLTDRQLYALSPYLTHYPKMALAAQGSPGTLHYYTADCDALSSIGSSAQGQGILTVALLQMVTSGSVAHTNPTVYHERRLESNVCHAG